MNYTVYKGIAAKVKQIVSILNYNFSCTEHKYDNWVKTMWYNDKSNNKKIKKTNTNTLYT